MGEVLEGVRQSNEPMSKLSAKEFYIQWMVKNSTATRAEVLAEYDQTGHSDTFTVDAMAAYHAHELRALRDEVGKISYELREGKDFGRGFDYFGERAIAILDKHIPKP